jgi:HK97 family phage major capsid protein
VSDTAYQTLAQLRERKEEVEREIVALDVSTAGKKFSEDERELFASLHEELADLKETIPERAGRERLLLKMAHTDAATSGFAGPGEQVDEAGPSLARDQALRTIEKHAGVLSPEAGDNLESLVRHRDPTGVDAKYITAAGSPHYASAFAKLLRYQDAHLRWSAEESAAVRRASAVEEERGLVSGVGAQGGFALPIDIDPSILLSSSGALNPVRSVARVITMSTREWRGVSSAGVTASYDPEAGEVSDDTPVLAQPTIISAMGRAFVPYSIEISADWAGISEELARITADARDVLDATMLYSGTGTDQPAGVRTGLTTTQRVLTDVAATFDVDDAYDIKGQLPARFMPNATWAAHPTKWDTIFRFTPSGSTTEPQALPTRDGAFIGRPKIEWTAVPTALTTGTTQLLYGDFRAAFTIGDRLGMTAEIVGHLMGATRRPTAERGFFCYWRTGSKTVIPEALRYLETL